MSDQNYQNVKKAKTSRNSSPLKTCTITLARTFRITSLHHRSENADTSRTDCFSEARLWGMGWDPWPSSPAIFHFPSGALRPIFQPGASFRAAIMQFLGAFSLRNCSPAHTKRTPLSGPEKIIFGMGFNCEFFTVDVRRSRNCWMRRVFEASHYAVYIKLIEKYDILIVNIRFSRKSQSNIFRTKESTLFRTNTQSKRSRVISIRLSEVSGSQ